MDERLIRLLPLAAAALWLTPAAEVAGKRRPPAGSGHFRRAPIQRATPGPGQVQVGRFLSAQGLPRGGRAHGQVGDYFVRSGRMLAVVRARDGALVDLALARSDGARPQTSPSLGDQLGWAKVRVCDGQGAHEVALRKIRLLTGRGSGGSGLQVLGEVSAGGAALEVTTTYSLTPDGQHLTLTTHLRNNGGAARRNVGVCDHLGTGNTRLQLPGLGEVREPGTHRVRSCGRSEAGLSTILAVPAAQPPMLLALTMWPPRGAFDPNLEPDYGRHDLQPRQSVTVRRFLVLARGGYHLALARAWRLSRPRASLQQVLVWPPDRRVPGSRIVVRSGGAHSPLLITRIGRGPDAKQTLSLPAGGGPYTASLLVPGVGEGPRAALPLRAAAPQTVRLAAPPSGRLKLTVRAARQPGPVKLLLEGLGTTRRPDLGSGGGLRAHNVIYSATGSEELSLAAGTYRVTATRGPTFTLDTTTAVVRPDRTTAAQLQLRELLPTPGWIAADLHTHCRASYDSPTTARARVVAARAAGLGLLVASDHNAVTTALAPAAKQLGWGDALLVVPGQEVSTEGAGFGHFNVFPLPAGGRLAWSATTPAALFAAARRVGAARQTSLRARSGLTPLIQVNHPRMGSLGYFNQMGLDRTTGRARAPGYSADFDLLEVFNGDDLDEPAQVLRNLQEWFALLNRGRRYTATAGSDAHRLPHQEAGCPRNMILWRTDAADKAARPQLAQVLDALRAGRSYITTGPLVEFTARGAPLGSLVKVLGTRPVPLQVVLRGAPWIDVRKLQLWANGELVQTLGLAHPRGLRRRPLVRLQRTLLVSPRVDTWYVVTAVGASPDPTQQRRVLPFVVTNPIFIDADKDGLFTAINAEKRKKK